VQIWEKEENKAETFFKEYDATLNNDEVELDIETKSGEENLYTYKKESRYALHAKIVCETLTIKENKPNIIQVEVKELDE
jgi:hypothetical protein